MAVYQAPEEWTEWSDLLAAAIDGRSRWRLPLVMLGMLFAGVGVDWSADLVVVVCAKGRCREAIARVSVDVSDQAGAGG